MTKLQHYIDKYIIQLLEPLETPLLLNLCCHSNFSIHVFRWLIDKLGDIFNSLSCNKHVPIQLIRETITKPWCFDMLSQCKDVRELEANPDLPWNWFPLSNKVSLRFFRNVPYPIIWHWVGISENENIPLTFIFETIDVHPWVIHRVLERKDLTLHCVLELLKFDNTLKFRNLRNYQRNLATEEDVTNNPNLDWNYMFLMSNHNISEEFIINNDYKPWDWSVMHVRAFSYQFIIKYKYKTPYFVCGDKVSVDEMINSGIRWNIPTPVMINDSNIRKFQHHVKLGNIKLSYLSTPEYAYLRSPNISINYIINVYPKTDNLHILQAALDKKGCTYDMAQRLSNSSKYWMMYWIKQHLKHNEMYFHEALELVKKLPNPNVPYCIRPIFDIDKFARQHMAAYKIQRWWLDHYYNPTKHICQQRLLREYHTLSSV